jgi:hypothetical protein
MILPARSPKDNWPIIAAILVVKIKYQYWDLVDTPEKSA